MRRPAFFLAFGADHWHAARVTGDQVDLLDLPTPSEDERESVKALERESERPEGDPSPSDSPTLSRSHALTLSRSHALDLAARLAAWGYRGQGVCLGIPSEWILATPVDPRHLPRRNRRAALLYRLEEQLPIDAEQLTAGFLPEVDGHALGLAVQTDRVRKVVEPLAAAGIQVASICPTALLALAGLCTAGASGLDYAVIATNGSLDLFRLVGGRPIAWSTSSHDESEALCCLEADLLVHPVVGRPLQARLVGPVGPRLAEAMGQGTSLQLLPAAEEPPLALAARAARDTLADPDGAWVDFRREGIVPDQGRGRLSRPFRVAVGLYVLLMVALCAAFAWRAAHYDALASRYQRAQAAEYQRLFPGAPVPPNVKSRLKSELARLAGLSGMGQEIPHRASALDTLRQVIASFPPALRLHIQQIRVGPADVLVEGQTRTHTDAETVAQALKRAGLIADPPRTESLAKGGVSFVLTAKLPNSGKPSDPEAAQP